LPVSIFADLPAINEKARPKIPYSPPDARKMTTVCFQIPAANALPGFLFWGLKKTKSRQSSANCFLSLRPPNARATKVHHPFLPLL
jgi:hypothetical protein